MNMLISTHKIPLIKTRIPRSLSEGPGYKAHWRFLQCEQYLIKIARTPDESAALRKILSDEKDPYVRQLLLFELGRASVIAESIKYALDCHNSQHENQFAWMISAMVVAGRSSSQIAEELGTDPAHIIAYEKIFFDVRSYLDLNFWIKPLCYRPGSVTGLRREASRWLITAYERGWNALAFTFSKPQWDLNHPVPAGKTICDRLRLGISARLADFNVTLEMGTVLPTAAEVELDDRIARLMEQLSPTLDKLDYPTALSPTEEKKRREAAELVGKMSPAARRKVIEILERLERIQ